MKDLRIFATATFGVESVVAREIKHLGYEDTHTDNGRVYFNGDFEALCRANLWLRCAERVFVLIGEFDAVTFDELFEGTKALPWEDWLPKDAEFPVTGGCVKSTLMSVSDCQSIIKKAIVERLKKVYKLEVFPETGPKYRIDFNILKDHVTISIDSSGSGLHKRGYRSLGYAAPIKETLASAILMISRWTPGRHLIDPFCGSGTIPIEAALMAMNKAPGLDRDFDCMEWPNIPKEVWYRALNEARDLIKPVNDIYIHGYDINPEAISMANYHAKQAGVANCLHLQTRDVRDLSSKAKYGFIVTNPPYGQRIGEKRENARLYQDMGKVFSKLSTWSYYIINADPEFEKHFGRKADKNRKLFNGGLLCYLYQYFGPKPPKEEIKLDKS
ncbi:MAG: class I SAM-dependent RNA methyltransferase [Clostridiaceae bacterium]|nr:class I SAM-dependent RNA methyltransferase [Clostridiaceae bacterium]